MLCSSVSCGHLTQCNIKCRGMDLNLSRVWLIQVCQPSLHQGSSFVRLQLNSTDLLSTAEHLAD